MMSSKQIPEEIPKIKPISRRLQLFIQLASVTFLFGGWYAVQVITIPDPAKRREAVAETFYAVKQLIGLAPKHDQKDNKE